MTIDHTTPASAGVQNAQVFGEQLTALFLEAGNPTLKQAARAGTTEQTTLTIQRISNWRRGTHLPKSFDTVQPLLTWLTEQAVQRSPGGQDELLTLDQWRELLTSDLPPTIDLRKTPSPYRGLSSFTSSDRDIFFGREDVVAKLGSAILREFSAVDGPRLVVMSGESGAGKSSVLGAGLATDSRLDGYPIDRVVVQATDLPRLEQLFADGVARVLALDQFENIFLLDGDEVVAFVGELVAALTRTDSVAVLGVRSDFLKQCTQVPALMESLTRGIVFVPEMSEEQLKRAITGPALHAGCRVDADLTEMLVEDINAAAPAGGRAGLLPLLAYVLDATWNARSGSRMSVKSYLATGGLAKTVAVAAESAWESVDERDRDLARELILSMTYLTPTGVALRVPLARAVIDTRPEALRVLNIFAAARLVTISTGAAMLIHDVVLKTWPRLDSWLTAGRESKLVRQRVEADAAEWAATGEDPGLLYRGSRLDEAVTSTDRSPQIAMPESAVRFLDAASRNRKRGRRTRLVGVAMIVVLAVTSTVIAWVAMGQNRDLVRERNSATYSSLLARIENLSATNPTVAAQLLLVANRTRPGDPAVVSQLRDVQNAPLAQTLTGGHEGDIYDVSFSRDGSVMGSASKDRTAKLWRRGADGGYSLAGSLSGYSNYVTSVSFSPDGRFAATGSGDGTLRVWDVSDLGSPRLVSTERPGQGTVYIVRFSPDGRMLAAPSDDGSVTVYDVGEGGQVNRRATLAGHGRAVRTVAFSPDSQLLATGSDDKTVRLWRTAATGAGEPAGPPLTGFPSIAHSVAFSPDGRELAVTGDGSNSQVWDVSDLGRPAAISSSLPGMSAGSWSIAYGQGGRLLASALADGNVQVWSQAAGQAPTSLWTLQRRSGAAAVRMFSATFSPDGRSLVVGRADGNIDVWTLPSTVHTDRSAYTSDVAHQGDLVATVGHDATLSLWRPDASEGLKASASVPVERRVNDYPSLAISHDASQVATANNNGGAVQLWDVRDRAAPRLASTIPAGTRYTFAVDFAPDRQLLVAGSDDRSLQLWDTSAPEAPRPVGSVLSGPTDLIRSAAFSPDGSRLAVASDDGRTLIFDVASALAGDRVPVPRVLEGTVGAQQVRWTPDGRVLLVAGHDLTSWLVEGDDARLQSRVPRQVATSMSVSPNGRFAAVGLSSRVVRAFTIDSDGRLAPDADVLPSSSMQRGAIHTEFIGPSKLLMTGDSSGALHVRDLDIGASERWICSAGEPISQAEWAAYMPDEPFSPPC